MKQINFFTKKDFNFDKKCACLRRGYWELRLHGFEAPLAIIFLYLIQDLGIPWPLRNLIIEIRLWTALQVAK